MNFPVRIALRRSRFLLLFLLIAHATAALCAAILPWPAWLRLALIGALAVSLWRALRPEAIVGLTLRDAKTLQAHEADGEALAVDVLPATTVFNRLIVLHLRVEDTRHLRALTLFPDQMSDEDFRRLRLWLRFIVNPKNNPTFVTDHPRWRRCVGAVS